MYSPFKQYKIWPNFDNCSDIKGLRFVAKAISPWEIYARLANKMANWSQLILSLTLLQTNNAILSTIQTGHQSTVGNLSIASKTSTAFKHLPQRCV